MRLDLDSAVTCTDGPFGELSDIIIDPSTLRVTHLVVQPPEHHHLARLMPINRARDGEQATAGVALDCTLAEINELPPIHESDFVRLSERPMEDVDSDVGIEDGNMLPPMESLGAGALGAESIDVDPYMTVSFDRVPKGTVEIRGRTAVWSSDGHHVGHVVAIVVDERDQIAQLVFEHRHLFSKRDLELPSGSIDRIRSDEVVLTLSKDEVGR
jgi:sporulation protein YlmC with PRC-barrel domain